MQLVARAAGLAHKVAPVIRRPPMLHPNRGTYELNAAKRLAITAKTCLTMATDEPPTSSRSMTEALDLSNCGISQTHPPCPHNRTLSTLDPSESVWSKLMRRRTDLSAAGRRERNSAQPKAREGRASGRERVQDYTSLTKAGEAAGAAASSFAMKSNLGARARSGDEITAVVAGWRAGAISRDTMLQRLKRGEVLPDGRSVAHYPG